MADLRCETCWFYDANQASKTGLCRRYPPVPVVEHPTLGTITVVPGVTPNQRACGEHRSRILDDGGIVAFEIPYQRHCPTAVLMLAAACGFGIGAFFALYLQFLLT